MVLSLPTLAGPCTVNTAWEASRPVPTFGITPPTMTPRYSFSLEWFP